MQRHSIFMVFMTIMMSFVLSGCGPSRSGRVPVLDIADLVRVKTRKEVVLHHRGERQPLFQEVLLAPVHSKGEGLPPVTKTGWRWPTEGTLLRPYSEEYKGIWIGAALGARVHAAASGEVVYAGTGLKQYGRLVLLKHAPSYFTAYGYNHSIRVREGEHVQRGTVIGMVGLAPNKQPALYFEIRRDEKAIDPVYFLTH